MSLKPSHTCMHEVHLARYSARGTVSRNGVCVMDNMTSWENTLMSITQTPWLTAFISPMCNSGNVKACDSDLTVRLFVCSVCVCIRLTIVICLCLQLPLIRCHVEPYNRARLLYYTLVFSAEPTDSFLYGNMVCWCRGDEDFHLVLQMWHQYSLTTLYLIVLVRMCKKPWMGPGQPRHGKHNNMAVLCQGVSL